MRWRRRAVVRCGFFGLGQEMCQRLLKDLFLTGNEVVALDLVRPGTRLSAASHMRPITATIFALEQGDATKMAFADGSFDAAMSSLFLCQISIRSSSCPRYGAFSSPAGASASTSTLRASTGSLSTRCLVSAPSFGCRRGRRGRMCSLEW